MDSSALILPLLVFAAESCVVTLSTMRTIFIAKGWKLLAPLLGFFEVSIWLFAIGQVMQNLSRIDCFLAFAGGFSLGNYLGILLEGKLALGHAVVQITTRKTTSELIAELRSAGYGATVMDARGVTGLVQVIFTVIRRKELDAVLAIIQRFDPEVFFSVNDLQSACAGVFPRCSQRRSLLPSALVDFMRMPAINRESADDDIRVAA